MRRLKIPNPVSEIMSATGGARSELFRNVVDSSSVLDRWSVFVRETLQNSNDQRLPELNEIKFGLHYKTIEGPGLETLKKMFLQEAPHSADPNIGIKSSLSSMPLLVVTDTGTHGLSGGIDPQKAGEDSNFCNFFYFSGQLETRQSGGGSYGIGRNVLFWASRIKTILVYSQTIFEGQQQKRFMATAAGKSFSYRGRNYTGRHWWGEPDNERQGGVLPILGDEAEALAKAFGLHEYLEGSTGTAIGVIDPDFDDASQEMASLRDSLLINAWPLLVSSRDIKPALVAEISVGGDQLPVPEPRSSISPVKNYVDAYMQNETGTKIHSQSIFFDGSNEGLKDYVSSTTSKELGVLSWIKKIEPEVPEQDLQSKGLPAGSSIALMRSSKIVVKYLRVPNPEDSSVVFGTFVANENYERAFRKSETATHDEWHANRLGLSKGQRNPILQTLEKIQRVFAQSRSASSELSSDTDVPIQIANKLGKLITGLGVTGGHTRGAGVKNTTSKKPSIRSLRYSTEPRLVRVDNNTCFGEVIFKVQGEFTPDQPKLVRPKVRIWLGDSFEKESPAGSNKPTVIGVNILTEQGFKSCEQNCLDLEKLIDGQEVKVEISYPDDVQVVCDFVPTEEGENE